MKTLFCSLLVLLTLNLAAVKLPPVSSSEMARKIIEIARQNDKSKIEQFIRDNYCTPCLGNRSVGQHAKFFALINARLQNPSIEKIEELNSMKCRVYLVDSKSKQQMKFTVEISKVEKDKIFEVVSEN